MTRKLVPLFILVCATGNLRAQDDGLPISIFGYFQNYFFYETGETSSDEPDDSFSLQQVNLFFQKDIAARWRAFVNFEYVNTFSSSQDWGSARLEEAWLRYQISPHHSIKLGLLIPVFNHLNEIKNRTPLLPYVIRPLVYETSFSEFITVEEYTPTRAFAQLYGFIPVGTSKLDYALYVGNSPSVNSDPEDGQTGIDTTASVLVGGRMGLRTGELKVGISSTLDKVNYFQDLVPLIKDPPAAGLEGVLRSRLGADFSFHAGPMSLYSELIKVRYDDEIPEISVDREFYYATLAAQCNEQLLLYGSCWFTDEDITELNDLSGENRLEIIGQQIKVPTLGVSYTIKERITFKAQLAKAFIRQRIDRLDLEVHADFYHISTAVSVFF